MHQPSIHVGILEDRKIRFLLQGDFTCRETGETFSGEMSAGWLSGYVSFAGSTYREVHMEPLAGDSFFTLHEVVIGVGFHWERKEEQSFRGSLQLLATDDSLWAINILPLEEYLTSVISSEMNANASAGFLKAHAVISRSWLMAQITREKIEYATGNTPGWISKDEYVRWYDHEDHTLFDVCADDHCQRYQGITRISSPQVEQIIRETAGEIVCYDGRICDTRFSKCCGGITEKFENCWEPVVHPYLAVQRDDSEQDIPDLRIEQNAKQWITSSPTAYCNTTDKMILEQVLNNYDQETIDFYRWEVRYSQAELAALIRKRAGLELGHILDLIPQERGGSGRIIRLKIVGSARTVTIGKELEIRRTLSETHLYSSAFIVEKFDICEGIPQQFILRGAGWGHGVGLCQIGAAVMGEKGYPYDRILAHYFPCAQIDKIY